MGNDSQCSKFMSFTITEKLNNDQSLSITQANFIDLTSIASSVLQS